MLKKFSCPECKKTFKINEFGKEVETNDSETSDHSGLCQNCQKTTGKYPSLLALGEIK